MAQLAKTPCPGNFDELQRIAAKVDPAVSLVGALVTFPWADGQAIYRVSKDKPLTLQHVPVFDAWQVPYTQIRGIRRADVVAMIEADRKIGEFFKSRSRIA